MKRKILIVILCLIFLYCIGGVVYSVLIKQVDEKESVKSSLVSVDNYEYKIDSDVVSSLYKKEFDILKANLESEEINFDEYVKSLAKLYVIDLYSLNSKNNKYDVTASQYVFSNGKENFKLKVSESIYKYIEDNGNGNGNGNGDRKQELPCVSEIFVNSVNESSYMIGDILYDAYLVDISWLYEKDMGYETNCLLTLIKDNNVVSVVEESKNKIVQE